MTVRDLPAEHELASLQRLAQKPRRMLRDAAAAIDEIDRLRADIPEWDDERAVADAATLRRLVDSARRMITGALDTHGDLLATADEFCSTDFWEGLRPFRFVTDDLMGEPAGEIIDVEDIPGVAGKVGYGCMQLAKHLREVARITGAPVGARVHGLDGAVRNQAQAASDVLTNAGAIALMANDRARRAATS